MSIRWKEIKSKIFSDGYPILFGFFIPLGIYLKNMGEIDAVSILPSLTAILFITILLQAVLRRIDNNTTIHNILISFFWIAFFQYTWLTSVTGIRGRYLAPLIILFLILSFKTLKLAKISFVSYTERLMRVTSIILITYQIVSIALFSLITYNDHNLKNNQEVKKNINDKRELKIYPDVYYIIFDGYPGQEALENIFGYNNQEFIDNLLKRKFYVGTKSLSNYDETICSIPSSLNMKYINFLDVEYTWGQAKKIGRELLNNSLVLNTFSKNGYSINIIETSPMLSIKNKKYLRYNYFDQSLYSLSLIKATPLFHIETIKKLLVTSDSSGNLWDPNSIFWGLEKIGNIESVEEPIFVFAHIYFPHKPFYFDSQGNVLTKYRDEKWDNKTKSAEEINDAFIQQILFLQKKIIQLIDYLLSSRGHIKPIIVIQGDHGTRFGNNSHNKVTRRLQQFSILNALYLPYEIRKNLYETITPVNTFRLITNELFNKDYNLLNDVSYYVDHKGNTYNFKFRRAEWGDGHNRSDRMN